MATSKSITRTLTLGVIIILLAVASAAQASDWGCHIEAEGTPLEKRVALVESTEIEHRELT